MQFNLSLIWVRAHFATISSPPYVWCMLEGSTRTIQHYHRWFDGVMLTLYDDVTDDVTEGVPRHRGLHGRSFCR